MTLSKPSFYQKFAKLIELNFWKEITTQEIVYYFSFQHGKENFKSFIKEYDLHTKQQQQGRCVGQLMLFLALSFEFMFRSQ